MEVLNSDHRVARVFHIADLHVSTDNDRTNEYVHVFDGLLDKLSSHPATIAKEAILVIAGDVLHNKCRTSTEGARILFDFLNRCLKLFPVLVICGNHDFRQDEPSITDAIDMIVSPYDIDTQPIHYLRNTGLYRWGNVGFGVTSVKDTLRQRNTSGLVSTLPDYPSPRAFGTDIDCRVALFHGTVCRSFVGTERHGFTLSSSYPITWFEGYDIGMFGDNHTQQMNTEPNLTPPLTWGYPGSLVQQNFGELLSGHGYIEWNVLTKTGTLHDVPNEFGRLTMVRSYENTWLVVADGKTGVPLPEACAYFPKRALVRAEGNKTDAEEALRSFGFTRVTVLPFSQVSKSGKQTATIHCSKTHIEDLNNPETWIKYIEETSSVNVDEEMRDMLSGRGLLLPSQVVSGPESLSLAIDTAACNAEIEKLTEDFVKQTETARRENVSLLRIDWSWLLCYGPDNYFDFRMIDGKIALLNGPNASGKSSFLDVICVAIFGEPTSGRSDMCPSTDDVVCNVRPPHSRAHATLSFQVDGQEFEIHRAFVSRGTRQAKTATVNRVMPDRKILEAEGSVKVREFVFRTFGTIDGLLSSSMVQQMDNASFFYQKSSRRKETIESALNIESINRYESLLKKTVSVHKRALNSCDAIVRERMSNYPIRATEDELIEAEKRLESINEKIANVTTAQAVSMRGLDIAVAEEIFDGRSIEQLEEAASANATELLKNCYDPDDLKTIRSRRAALRLELEEIGTVDPGSNGETITLTDLKSESAVLDARRPREMSFDDYESDRLKVDGWFEIHAGYMEKDIREIYAYANEADERVKSLSIVRDELLSSSFLRSYACQVIRTSRRHSKEVADGLRKTMDDLERRRPYPYDECDDLDNRVEEYDRWRKQFPAEWTPEIADKRIKDLTEELSKFNEELSEIGFAIINVPASRTSSEHDIHRLKALRSLHASYDKDSKYKLGSSFHMEFVKRSEEREKVLKLIQNSSSEALRLELSNAMLELRSQMSLRERVEMLRRESQVYIDINPECRSCLKRNSYVRKLKAQEELALGEGELKAIPIGRDVHLQSTIAYLNEIIPDVIELENDTESFEIERLKWEETRRLLNEINNTKAELVSLEEAAGRRRDFIQNAVDNIRKTRNKLERYSSEVEDKEHKFKCAKWQKEYNEVYGELTLEYIAWRRDMDEVEEEIRLAAADSKKARVYLEEREEMVNLKKHVKTRDDDVHCWMKWTEERRNLDNRLAEAERTARFARARTEDAELMRLEHIQCITKDLERINLILAHRRWISLEDERSRLLTESNGTAARIAVLKERLASQKVSDSKSEKLHKTREILQTRTTKLKKLYEAFTGGDEGAGGFKEWLYKSRVAPFLEKEVNAFVSEVDNFRMRVGVRKADELTFKIEDRNACPSLDHASGYQKFVLGLAMRIALGRIGASGHNIKHFFLDEGFTACDSGNMKKSRYILEALMRLGDYQSIILVSHLDLVREIADINVQVERRKHDPVSRVSFGTI